MPKKIKRVVRWFNKKSDALVGEVELINFELTKLQKLFYVSENNPMYDCYPVKTEEQILYIRAKTKYSIDVTTHDYFLECEVKE